MKIKRIRALKVNSYKFTVKWSKEHDYASFNYANTEIDIGVKENNDDYIFMLICHELMEICAIEMFVRYQRPDVDSDYMFVYDHRQHTTMMDMFAGLLTQFIGD